MMASGEQDKSCSGNSKLSVGALGKKAPKTSLAGLRNICGSNISQGRKIIWVMFYCAIFSSLFYLLGSSLIAFESYQAVTMTTIEPSEQQQFPEIKFCQMDLGNVNQQAAKMNFFEQNGSLIADTMRLIPTLLRLWHELHDELYPVDIFNDPNFNDDLKKTLFQSTPIRDILTQIYFVPSQPRVKMGMDYLVVKNGYHLQGFIEKCRLGDIVSCNVSTRPFIDYHNQIVCETFHSSEYIETFDPLIQNKTGEKNSITLSLANIYDPSSSININFGDEGLYRNEMHFSSHTQLFIGLQKVRVERLSTPYAIQECFSDAEADDYANQFLSNKPYSKQRCLHRCFEKQRRLKCGCTFDTDEPYCTVHIFYQAYIYNCTVDELQCTQCKPKCNQVFYRTHVSRRFNQFFTTNEVHLYFSSLDTVVETQVPSLTLTQLFSNFGGLVGLFVGISLLSLVESLDLMLAKKSQVARSKEEDKNESIDDKNIGHEKAIKHVHVEEGF